MSRQPPQPPQFPTNSQSRLPFSQPCISEESIAAVTEVLRSGWITSGPKVLEFERDFASYVGAAHAVAVSSATAGLDIIFQALELQPGDEVITPSINWVSGPNMVELNGGRTVFCDVEPETLNLDLRSVARLITRNTRAIMPVHFAGAPCDLDGLRSLVAGSKISIIEDAAHAAGTRCRGRLVGSDSDLAVFSFHPTKNMTTAEGGMVVCRSEETASRIRLGRFHGISKDAWKQHGRGGNDLYQVLTPGRKYNLTDMQAVLGIHQLRALEEMNAERTHLANGYHERLQGRFILRPLARPTLPFSRHSWHLFIILLQFDALRGTRADVVDRLEAAGIGTALHFPAVHRQQYYADKYPQTSLPVSERVSEQLLSLPLFPGMQDADLDRVCEALVRIEKDLAR